MIRFVAVLFASLVAVAAVAAPAPFDRPWITGWRKPHEPKGCRVVRKGGELTLSPGGNGRWVWGVEIDGCPHLLREVKGDFALSVRVRGDFDAGVNNSRLAGIVMTNGKEVFLWLRRGGGEVFDGGGRVEYSSLCLQHAKAKGTDTVGEDGPPLAKPAYLRLVRRANGLFFSARGDGKEWKLYHRCTESLQGKVKVGVLAEATECEGFRAVFDELTLTKELIDPTHR